MKKKIALLALLVLVMTVILAACTKTPDATKIIPRWDGKNTESYEFAISLADFDLAADGSVNPGHFKSYGLGQEKYYKDFDVRMGETFTSLDEIRPTNVTGKFTLTIVGNFDDGYDLLKTQQEMELTYDAKLIKSEFLAEIKSNDETKNLLISESDSSITLKSTTETTVEFLHEESQAPRRSSTKVVGFYVGKVHQEVSVYEISTEYDYQDKNTTITSTITQNGKTDKTETTLKRRTQGSFIDSNQLITYARSLDKSSKSFQDNPNVLVYNPMTRATQIVTFAFSPSANAILYDQSRDKQLYVKIPTIGIVINGMPFMLQECAPKLQEQLPDLFDSQDIGPDVALFAGRAYAKHTTLRFRVGYIAYELTEYETGLWDALSSIATNK